MKKNILSLALVIGFLFTTKTYYSQINYNFTGVSGVWTANTTPTVLHGSAVDDAISASTAIGFNFYYGCQLYTTFQASSNGVMFLGTTGAFSNSFNDLTASTDRPAIAPLWDDLATGSGGNVNYKVTGAVGSRVLTVEWKQMEWTFSGTTWAIEFQAKLYETSNRIEFVYNRNGNASANIAGFPGASIGLGGQTSGDFYSLNGVGASPAASKVTETNNLSTKPASGQIYQWDPVICSGAPTAGTASSTPSLACGAFSHTLTLSGGTNACGITYQWQSAPAAIGPWTNITGATAASTVVTTSTTTYYRCVSACGASTVASSAATASVTVAGACGICAITSMPSLPYSTTGQTTCGQGNDVTSTNVTNVCGSSLYYGGEDVVYSFTPTATGQVNIYVNSSGTYMGAMLYQGCPVSGGTCAGSAQSSAGNQTLCATVTSGQVYYLILDSYPAPTCNPYSFTVTAPTPLTGCNMAYTASSTTFSYVANASLPTTVTNSDDVLNSTVVSFGFPFCYDGAAYWGGYIAANSSFVFDALPCFPNISTTTYAAGGVSTGYSITNPAPVNSTSIPRNAILGPWHDVNPGSTSMAGSIRYATLGATPTRTFVVGWDNIPMFSSTCETVTAQNFSGQIRLMETTNVIEIHVKNKQVCSSWNNGQAVLGLHNFDGTIYVPPVNATAHNATAITPYNQWTMTNTAYRFTTSCGSGFTCKVLPVEFSDFYGERVNSTNNLFWVTASEENIKYYIVERSTDAVNFEGIGTVNALNKANKYHFEDLNSIKGVINYYRITSIEKNGQRSSTFVYPLGASLGEFAVTGIYPNPATSSISFAIDSKVNGSSLISIYDVFGKRVKEITQNIRGGVTSMEVNIEDLSSGLYMFEIRDSNNQVISIQKLVKSN